jgi:hypothetical protein
MSESFPTTCWVYQPHNGSEEKGTTDKGSNLLDLRDQLPEIGLGIKPGVRLDDLLHRLQYVPPLSPFLRRHLHAEPAAVEENSISICEKPLKHSAPFNLRKDRETFTEEGGGVASR